MGYSSGRFTSLLLTSITVNIAVELITLFFLELRTISWAGNDNRAASISILAIGSSMKSLNKYICESGFPIPIKDSEFWLTLFIHPV